MDNDKDYIDLTEEDTKPSKPKKKKKGTAIKVILIVILCLLVAGVLAIGGETIYKRYQSGGVKGVFNPSAQASASDNEAVEEEPIVVITPTPAQQTEVPEENEEEKDEPIIHSPDSNSGDVLSAAEIYEQNVDAMVSIKTSVSGTNIWGQRVEGAASGSGFIVSENGFILTNYHVIEDARSIEVITYDGQNYNAQVVGYNEKNDIAVLKIDGKNPFQVVTVGDSDKCRVGEEVVAIGNALGEFDFSMTRGIISGLARDVKISANNTMTLIQTDCTINSGNSGGALFNMKGEVIGITNAKYSSSGSYGSASIENIGFAIPINSVVNIVESIMSGKGDSSPFIGVTITEISADVANATGVDKGAFVYDVTEGGPAYEAGMKAGDIIVEIDGTEINSKAELKEYISACNIGDKINVVVSRQGAKTELTVTVGATQNSDTVIGSNTTEEAEEPKDGYQFGYGNGNDFGYGYGNDFGYGNGSQGFSGIFGNYGFGY